MQANKYIPASDLRRFLFLLLIMFLIVLEVFENPDAKVVEILFFSVVG